MGEVGEPGRDAAAGEPGRDPVAGGPDADPEAGGSGGEPARGEAEPPSAAGPLTCSCGALLAEDIDEGAVRVGGRWHPFRRSTDYLVCGGCGAARRVRDLREVARGGETGAGGAEAW